MFQPNYVLLALAFSVGIDLLLPRAKTLLTNDKVVGKQFGTMPPDFGSYFNFPAPWLVLLFFSALSEEFIFRGLLQSRFVQRYELHRGILLSGIVWAAYTSAQMFLQVSRKGVLLQLGFRVFMCLALSFVLGWLVLRSGSLLPACHRPHFLQCARFGGLDCSLRGKQQSASLFGVLWRSCCPLLAPVQVTAAPE